MRSTSNSLGRPDMEDQTYDDLRAAVEEFIEEYDAYSKPSGRRQGVAAVGEESELVGGLDGKKGKGKGETKGGGSFFRARGRSNLPGAAGFAGSLGTLPGIVSGMWPRRPRVTVQRRVRTRLTRRAKEKVAKAKGKEKAKEREKGTEET